MIDLPGLEIVFDLGPDHERCNSAAATLRDPGTAAKIGVQIALIPDNEQEPISTGLKLGAGQYLRNLLLEPPVGLRSRSVVPVVQQVGSDVRIVWGGVVRDVFGKLCERNTV